MRAPNRSIPPLTPQDILRFWSHAHIGKSNECWPWNASCDGGGYGSFGCRIRNGGPFRTFKAHRVAWTIAYGPIPPGMNVLHDCDNPPCCNPACLFLGTQADNNRDAAQKGRASCGDEHWTHKHPELVPHGDKSWFHNHPQPHRGEKNGCAKLTTDQVREIRRHYAASNITQCALAREYGVSQPVISSIVRRKKWVHV